MARKHVNGLAKLVRSRQAVYHPRVTSAAGNRKINTFRLKKGVKLVSPRSRK